MDIQQNIDRVKALLDKGDIQSARDLLDEMIAEATPSQSRTLLHDLGNAIQRAIFKQHFQE